MGYTTGFEWLWFIMGMGFFAFIAFGVFITVMITKFYCLLKNTLRCEDRRE